jgi:L-lactate dehydrogenase complex protein LldG
MNSASAKDKILDRIRQAVGQDAREYSDEAFQRLLATAPKSHESLSAIPDAAEAFITQAQAVGVQIAQLDGAEQVPDWLRRSSFADVAVTLADQPDIAASDWSGLNLDSNYAEHGQVGVVKASLAAAETGTVLLHSHEVPSGLLYLVDRLVILLNRADIKARYEELWAAGPQGSPQGTPRAIHLITGPSRTADVEQTIQVGAHGPREVFIVILNNN